MTSLPSLVIAGSGLSLLAARLSLTLPLLLPIPLPCAPSPNGRNGRRIQHFASGSDSCHDGHLSSPLWGRLVLQPAEPWHSLVESGCDLCHSTGRKECKLAHCFISTVSVTVIFFIGFFPPFFSSSGSKLQMLRKRRRTVGEPNSLGRAVIHMYRKLNAEIIACKAVKEVTGL